QPTATATPAAVIGATVATAPQCAPARLPRFQVVMARSASLPAANISNPSSALATALIAMPVTSSGTTSVRPPARDIAYTSSVVRSANPNAAVTIVQLPRTLSPNTMTVAAPTAAPQDTPITAGSASGLPKTPCMTAPDAPSAAPTSTASATRGNRTSHSALSPCAAVGRGPTSSPTRCRIDPMTSSGGTLT